MTAAENTFYQVLQEALGTEYTVYPQAHLDVFLDHTTAGQNWKGALNKIQRKSVDFLICNRKYYNPLVAIELDEASHQKPDRLARDQFVEEICRQAGMPLVRVKTSSRYDQRELLAQLAPYLR